MTGPRNGARNGAGNDASAVAMHDDLARYWDDLAALMRAVPVPAVARVADLLLDCHRRDATVFVLGNGGSASTASHFACDLAKGTQADGVPAFRAVAIGDNVALLTAWANDVSYERVFAEQLAALVRPGDVVVLISTSGNSPNVLAAAEVARAAGATSVALTDRDGGRLCGLADLTIRVPTASTQQAEDAHLAIAHSLCVALRGRLHAQAAAHPAEMGDPYGDFLVPARPDAPPVPTRANGSIPGRGL